jgi:solute:Na+ symporter, SSS family
LFWKQATSKAAFSAIIASMIVIFITFIIYGITSTLPIIFGVFTGLVVIIALTLFSTSRVDSDDSEKTYIS